VTHRSDIRIVRDERARGFVIVDKPAGLLSVPGRGAEHDPRKADCVVARVRARFPEATGPMVVHRLDMDTSGLMVVATTPQAQRELSIAFSRRAVEKAYEAMLLARDAPHAEKLRTSEGGLIDAPMRLDIDRRPYQVHDPHRGKPAQTRWTPIESARPPGERFGEDANRIVRVRFEPITGRSHQLRVHAALAERIGGQTGGLGAPILGDPLYSAGVGTAHEDLSIARPPDAPMPTACVAAGRLLLHACELALAGVRVRSEPPF
jgi:tRNA pseudouridine32 synthase/23S rRNA pseudouridine746 synthase